GPHGQGRPARPGARSPRADAQPEDGYRHPGRDQGRVRHQGRQDRVPRGPSREPALHHRQGLLRRGAADGELPGRARRGEPPQAVRVQGSLHQEGCRDHHDGPEHPARRLTRGHFPSPRSVHRHGPNTAPVLSGAVFAFGGRASGPRCTGHPYMKYTYFLPKTAGCHPLGWPKDPVIDGRPRRCHSELSRPWCAVAPTRTWSCPVRLAFGAFFVPTPIATSPSRRRLLLRQVSVDRYRPRTDTVRAGSRVGRSPMARSDKAAAVAELSEEFRESNGAVLTAYRGLSVADISELRRGL